MVLGWCWDDIGMVLVHHFVVWYCLVLLWYWYGIGIVLAWYWYGI